MDRLTLTTRHITAENEKCLPAGDGLPLWSEVPLYAKLPVYPNPRDSYKLCTTRLCEPKHKTAHIDFDLTDPCGHFTFSEYEPLHDPHLRNHFNDPRMRRHLVRNGFLHDGKVVCDLKEFNKYRQYLRKMFLMEMEYERHKEQTLTRKCVSKQSQESYTKQRLEVVRRRLQNMATLRRQKYEADLAAKTERIEKRQAELNGERAIIEARNRHMEKKRKHTLQQHREMIDKRNKMLMRRWKIQERQRNRRMQEAKQQQIMTQRQKTMESWEARKRNQKEKLDRETKALARLEEDKSSRIVAREKRAHQRRQQLQGELSQIKERLKLKKEATERRHARRLAERLALADIRNIARRNARRQRGHKSKFYSMWDIVSSLRRMEVSEIKEDRSARFLDMLNDAYEEISIFIDETAGDEFDEMTEEELFQLKAKEIVMNVYNNVQTEYFSGMTEKQESRITFRGRTSVIPDDSKTSMQDLKPVAEHVVTPVPSSYELEALKNEELKEESRRKEEDIRLAENLLSRLITDLNKDKLERKDILKLTEYCLDIIQKRDYKSAVDENVDVSDLNEFQIAGFADNLVKFTLHNLIEDVKEGEISHEELTKLTLSIVGNQTNQDSMDTEYVADKDIDHFVEETLQYVINDEEIRVESPVSNVMLDDFIVSTLKTLADDVYHGRLPQDMIEDMLNLMAAEVGGALPVGDFKTILKNIIEELENEQSNSLYRVVHAFVSSYLSFKESSQESIEELINMIRHRIQKELKKDTEAGDSLAKIAQKISTQSLTTVQMCSIANDVISLSGGQSLTQVAKLVVDDAIEKAMTEFMAMQSDELTNFASKLVSSIDSVLLNQPSAEDEQKLSFTSDVAKFVTDVLQLVFKSLQKGQFTESDIIDMLSSVQKIARSGDDKAVILTNHIKALLANFSTTGADPKSLQELGSELILCGKNLMGIMEDVPSRTSARAPSLTSTAVADDLVGHLLKNVFNEFEQGEIRKETLKELAMCILRSTSSESSLSTSEIDKEGFSNISLSVKMSGVRYPSPCDSKVAEDIVHSALGQIMKDVDDGKLCRITLVSIASSAVSLFSTSDGSRQETLDTLMRNVISRLKEDQLSIKEVRRLFNIIIRKYRYDQEVMFPPREPASADSELAETLIRETMIKIDRDIRSRNYSDEDLVMFAEDARLSFNRMLQNTPQDVINLVTSAIRHLKSQIQESHSTDEVMQFLQIIDVENSENIKTQAEVIESLDNILADINENKHSSRYFKRTLRHFVSSQGTDKDIAVVSNILKSVDIGILSNFVKLTVADVLGELRKSRIQSAVEVSMSRSETGMLIQTASSQVANKLVHNLITRIEKTVLSGKTLMSDIELERVPIESREIGESSFAGLENDLLSRISSNALGAHILETLNNIISNMRLERSVDRIEQTENDGALDLQRRTSSNVIEDFVLETLQDIVENMQDQLSYNDMQELERAISDSSDTSLLVMNTLNNVLKDMSKELVEAQREETMASANKQVSTSSLEAEAVVVGAIHVVLQDFIGEEKAKDITRSFNFDIEDSKQHVLGALENIKRDINNTDDPTMRTEVTKIIQSTVEDDCNNDDFIETTINMIIETIENNHLKATGSARRGISSLSAESNDTFDIIVDSTIDNEHVMLDGRSVSLQKMAQMTSQMLKVHDENVRTTQSSRQDIVGVIPSEQVKELLTAAVSKTLENVESGIVSEKELHELANALSEKFSVESLDNFGESSETALGEAVEEFVVATLAKVKGDLESGCMTEGQMKVVLKSMTALSKSGHKICTSDASATSVSSEMLSGLVKQVLSNIIKSYNDSELNIKDDSKGNQDSVKSVCSNSSNKSTSSSIEKANINPNASKKRLSTKSYHQVEIPMKTTPLPILHSFTHIAEDSVSHDSSFFSDIRLNTQESCNVQKAKPMCMVTPQKATPTIQTKTTKHQGDRQSRIFHRQSALFINSRRNANTTVTPKIDTPNSNRHSVRNGKTASRGNLEQRTERGSQMTSSLRQHSKTPKSPVSPKASSIEQRPVSEQNRVKSLTVRQTNRRSVSCLNSSEKALTSIRTVVTPPVSTKSVAEKSLPTSPRVRKSTSAKKKNKSPSPGQVTSDIGDKSTGQQGNSPSLKNVVKSIPSEAMEIKSLCGSHKTKYSVRSMSEEKRQNQKRPPFH